MEKVQANRLAGLDVFRIMAALVVFLFHTYVHMKCNYGIFSGFVNMGAIFMTGFFMLSGYVLFITWKHKCLSEITNIKVFYKKRLIGIYPLYLLLTFLNVSPRGGQTLLVPIEILGLQSTFVSLFSYAHNSGTWFVSCLIICYLLYPFGQEVVKQISFKWKLIFVVVMGSILLYAPLVVIKYQTAHIYDNPFYRCLEFSIGIFLASISEKISKVKFHFLYTWKCFLVELFLLITGVSICVKRSFFVNDYMLYNWIALPVFIFMIMTLAGISSERMERSRVISYLSSISYCFFLAQFWVWKITRFILDYLDTDNNVVKICLSLVVCLLLSIVAHELFEKPVTKWLKKKCGVGE